jgi:hypothetical protein
MTVVSVSSVPKMAYHHPAALPEKRGVLPGRDCRGGSCFHFSFHGEHQSLTGT